MPPAKPKVIEEYEGRITGEYIANQVLQYKSSARHSTHKQQIQKNDRLYKGDLSDFYPKNERPQDHLRVENKYKNALHDIARLAAEPRPIPVFMQMSDSMAEAKRARIRANIVDTIWEVNRGPRLSRRFFMDLAGTGMCAAALYFNDQSEYAQIMRLDPRMCYPDVRNGALVSMVYVESVKVDVAEHQWPELKGKLKREGGKNADCTLAIYYDEDEVATAVVQQIGKTQANGYVVDRWEHGLGCVPVAFQTLDTSDSEFHGLFDQIGGPLAFRDRLMGYLDDYMEDMVHAPFEAKNVLNADDVPGPLTIFQHDPGSDDSFIRRVSPAAPAGTVFGLLQYAGEQESTEALQPPARIGQVRQSIASGDFVNSTQGALSSAVRELQDDMGDFRYQVDYIAMKIEKKFLNEEKPLIRAIGAKKTYVPEDDIGENYFHRIVYGASAGLDRQYADVRVIQHVGAGLISKKMGREQLEYVDDPFLAQNEIYQEQMAEVLFQRFSADPNTPLSAVASVLVAMSKGKDLVDVMQDQAQEMLAREEEMRQAALAAQGGPQAAQGEAPLEPSEAAAALEAGGTGEEELGAEVAPLRPFQPPVLQQQIVQSRRQ